MCCPFRFLEGLESVRMNILPRPLFSFQFLPVLVSHSTFKLLGKLILIFVWQNKRTRIQLKILMSTEEKEGLGFANLRNELLGSPALSSGGLDGSRI